MMLNAVALLYIYCVCGGGGNKFNMLKKIPEHILNNMCRWSKKNLAGVYL